MWAHETSAETTALPAAVWRLWADVESWPTWNADIERISIDGPFAQGALVTMTPFGQEPIELRITEAVEGELFVDEAAMGGVVIRTFHRIEPADFGRSRIVYRMEITGPDADDVGPTVGPQITADFPDTIDALIERAEGGPGGRSA
jgi:uncharacterized protein YndB with AHSA1/START domain